MNEGRWHRRALAGEAEGQMPRRALAWEACLSPAGCHIDRATTKWSQTATQHPLQTGAQEPKQPLAGGSLPAAGGPAPSSALAPVRPLQAQMLKGRGPPHHGRGRAIWGDSAPIGTL